MEATLYRKFTPVYTETECGNQTASLDRMDVGVGAIDIGLTIEVTCRNPNPYALKIVASTPGAVFVQVGGQHVDLGKLDLIPGMGLPEYGRGVLRVHMDTKLKGSEAEKLLPHFLTDHAVPILIELRFNIGVAISFGITRWSVTEPFEKACGLNMAGVLVNQFLPSDNSERSNRLGPLICRDDFDGLLRELPPVGEKSETPEDGNMGFTAAQVAPEEVSAGEMLKTVGLGVSFVTSLAWFCLFSLGSSATFAHRDGLKGLMSDLWGSYNGFYWRVLTGNAWNGAVLALASMISPCGLVVPQGWSVPLEQLIPPPRTIRETEVVSTSERCKCKCFEKCSAAGLLEHWRSLFSRSTMAKERSIADSTYQSRSKGKPAADDASGCYHRLSAVVVDMASPLRGPDLPPHAASEQNLATGDLVSPEDRPVRAKTSPMINAVSARRAGLREADPFDEHAPLSPPPPFAHPRSRSRGSPLQPAPGKASRFGDASPAIEPSSSAFDMDVPSLSASPGMDEVPSERWSSSGSRPLQPSKSESLEAASRQLPPPPPPAAAA